MIRTLVVALLGVLSITLMAWNLNNAPETAFDLARDSRQNPAQANQGHAGQDQETIVR